MSIQREEHEGTVSLFIQPLSGGELLSLMRIRADISPPDTSPPYTENRTLLPRFPLMPVEAVVCRWAMPAHGPDRSTP